LFFDPRVAAALWAGLTQGHLVFEGAPSTGEKLGDAAFDDDLLSLAPQFKIPVVIIEGPGDLVTPRARRFFDAVMAPHKEFHLLPGTGHLAIFRDPDGFLSLLLSHVRVLATGGAGL